MRIFLAGATGVIGSRLVSLLVEEGHEVTGMTRSSHKVASLADVGANPVVCDVFDVGALHVAVAGSRAEVVIHQLTDLPDDITRIAAFTESHNRIRREGTRNLIAASRAAGVGRFVAQSVAWELGGERGAAVSDLEEMVLAYPGVVVRYGQFYGPGTYYPEAPPPPPRLHIDAAALRTLTTIDANPGVVTIVEG